jgi:hypothetical protein
MHLFATLNFWKIDAVLSFLLNLRIAMLFFFQWLYLEMKNLPRSEVAPHTKTHFRAWVIVLKRR